MLSNSIIGGLMLVLSIVGATAAVIAAILAVRATKKNPSATALTLQLEQLEKDLLAELRYTRQDNIDTSARLVQSLGKSLSVGQEQASRALSSRQDSLQSTMLDFLQHMEGNFRQLSGQTEQQLTQVRQMVETRLTAIQSENHTRLDEMRQMVDEKLQTSLENKLDRSFSQVSARLEQVYRGLGEMQGLAASVGDLKKVLSNVKTRGTLGEVQLGMILRDILAPGQYAENVATREGSRNVVEYAVLLPGEGDRPVYLPIDAKFPADAYTQVIDAQNSGDPARINAANSQLSQRMRGFARDIHEKYIDPPHTTDFAILFLPFEGLYAQVLQLGLLEPLQREYKITIAGPTTMAALLNSLQMGFQTLAIQKRSSEVWEILGAVKTEFDRFGATLGATRQKLEQAGSELDRLVGVRTRMIQRRLAEVTALPDHRATELLEETEE